jgi:hypothetical protein
MIFLPRSEYASYPRYLAFFRSHCFKCHFRFWHGLASLAVFLGFFVLPCAAVCQGGYGSYVSAELSVISQPSCLGCLANTYGPKGSTAPCSSCPAGTVSKPGSDSQGNCHEAWVKLNKDVDFIPTANSQRLTQLEGLFVNEAECRSGCDADSDCIFFQWNPHAKSCAVYILAPAAAGASVMVQLGLRIEVGVYSVYSANETLNDVGKPLSISTDPLAAPDVVVASVADCTRRCDQIEACFAVYVIKMAGNGFQCSLRGGEVSADLKSEYRAVGSNIGAWSK